MYVIPSLSATFSGNINIELKGFDNINESDVVSKDTASVQTDFFIFSGLNYETFPNTGMPSVFQAAIYVGTDILAKAYIKWRAKDTSGNYLTDWIPGEITFGDATNLRIYDIAGTVFGKPDAGATILQFVTIRSFTFPAGMVGSKWVSSVAAAASSVFIVLRNGSPIATFTFAIGATIATFTNPATDVQFIPGDVLTVTAPNPQNATLSTVSGTFKGLL